MALVYVTKNLPGSALADLRAAGHEVVLGTGEPLTQALGARPYEALLCLLTDKIDASVLAVVPQLKIISNYAVGYDNINLAAAHERGIIVTNTPGVLTEAVAEHTLALILAAVRQIPAADQFVRAGKYQGWEPELFLGWELAGKTLGIVGLGRIGKKLGELAKGFKLNLIYTDQGPDSDFEQQNGAKFVATLDDLLPAADIISLHVPLVESTKHLITAERLAKMKPTAILVNTSRGEVVNEVALVAALKRGIIRAAALDVYENEPRLAPGLADLPNVVLTPHIASATHEARTQMAKLAVQNIIEVLAGQVPEFAIQIYT